MPPAEDLVARREEYENFEVVVGDSDSDNGVAGAGEAGDGKQRRVAREGNARALRFVVVSGSDLHAKKHHV